MQTANVLLSLNGDTRNQVPLYNVTVAEVAVLRYLHGEGAVTEIDIVGEVKRTHRQEVARLTERYGRHEDGRLTAPAVEALFPGGASRVFETFAELELPEEFFVATSRRAPDAPAAAEPAPKVTEKELSAMTVNELRAFAVQNNVEIDGLTRKADILEAIELHMDVGEPEAGDNDGVMPMNDEFAREADEMFS